MDSCYSVVIVADELGYNLGVHTITFTKMYKYRKLVLGVHTEFRVVNFDALVQDIPRANVKVKSHVES